MYIIHRKKQLQTIAGLFLKWNLGHHNFIVILGGLLLCTTVKAQEGLVPHWSFDNINNNQFIDHVTGELGGTIFGASTVPGVFGNALEFNGTDDFVRISNGNTEPPGFFADLSEGSISLWFRVDNIPAYGIRPIFYYGVHQESLFLKRNSRVKTIVHQSTSAAWHVAVMFIHWQKDHSY